MWLLLLCIVINGCIGILFKYFGKYQVHTFHAIMINYLICVACGGFTVGWGELVSILQQSWLWVALVLGFLFVLIFNAYAQAVQKSGVGIATIFQKLSLVAPVVVAILYYEESLTIMKTLGLLLTLLALFLLSKPEDGKWSLKGDLGVLILVFVGSCFIDLLLFLAEKESLAPGADVRFVSSIFFFAFVFGSIYYVLSGKERSVQIRAKALVAGILLGVPNFLSIYLLLKVLAMGLDGSVVFPANNVGVLLIATLFGVLYFKEKVTVTKIVGFVSAILAIVTFSIFK